MASNHEHRLYSSDSLDITEPSAQHRLQLNPAMFDIQDRSSEHSALFSMQDSLLDQTAQSA